MKVINSNNRIQIKNSELNRTNKSKENKSKGNKNMEVGSNRKDEFIKSDYSNNRLGLYSKEVSSARTLVDKGTAAETTVHVSRSAYDKIVSATTFGETKWSELGVDDNKRWVVVNGQRFEVEHSAQEKAIRRNASKTLLDYIIESEENIKDKAKDNGIGKPKGNIESLKNNQKVMELLGKIFNENTPEGILGKLS